LAREECFDEPVEAGTDPRKPDQRLEGGLEDVTMKAVEEYHQADSIGVEERKLQHKTDTLLCNHDVITM